MQVSRQITSKVRSWGKKSWCHPGPLGMRRVFVGSRALGLGPGCELFEVSLRDCIWLMIMVGIPGQGPGFQV